MRTLWRIFAGFFKWTWRLLNFVRNLVMNMFFILLVLVCAGIWMHISSANQAQHSTRGALLLDITGVIVDKPSASNRLGVIGRQLFGATPTACRKTPCSISSIPFVRRKTTATSPGSCWI
jgi:protease-4